MRTTVRLPDALLEEAKEYAQQRDITLTELLENGLRLAMKNSSPKSQEGVPLVLPVSKARGGLAGHIPDEAWNYGAGRLETLMDELEGLSSDQ